MLPWSINRNISCWSYIKDGAYFKSNFHCRKWSHKQSSIAIVFQAQWHNWSDRKPRSNHTKDFKNGTSCSFAWHQHQESRTSNQNWSAWHQYNATGWNIISCVFDMIFQWVSNLKVSTELHLLHPDTAAIWLKDCCKWRKPRTTKIHNLTLAVPFNVTQNINAD